MQEVQPPPVREHRPYRNRFLAALVATTLAASVSIIWLIALTLQDTRGGQLFSILFLGTCFIFVLAATSWTFLPRLRQAAKLEELLAEFVEFSDKFTRPRVYVHRLVTIPKELKDPKDFALLIMASSNGTLMMPRVLTDNNINEEYSLCLNLDDELYVIQSTGHLSNDGLHAAVCSNLRNNLLTVHVRLAPQRRLSLIPQQSKIPHGDFTLEGGEAEAFLKTLKLAHFFSINRNHTITSPRAAQRPF